MSEVKVNKISPRTNCGTVTVGDSGDSVSVSAGVPVTVNGDLKSNALKATDGGSIISQSGTTITIGASGDTVSLASGASQSGFGRSGSVDWQTGSIKTATFTAASGEGYFCNTSGGAFTVNLPAGSAGAIVAVADYTRTFQTNNLTISPNGSEKIGGIAQNAVLNIEGQAATFVYVDGTEGWINVQNAEDTETGLTPAFVAASGGTETTSGDFKIHTFTGPGTFTVSCAGNAIGSNTVDYLVLAGGGGGGTSGNPGSSHGGSGGGAGGYRFSNGTASGCYTTAPSPLAPLGASALPVSAQGYPIVVGGGGSGRGHPSTSSGVNGNTSSFSTISSAGGGGGGSRTPSGGSNGGDGGSGGGANSGSCAGSGNTPPVSPPQGNNGGTAACNGGAGGGGIGSAGVPSPGGNAGDGGNGIASSITASPVARGGGGGGGTSPQFGAGCGQAGGGNGASGGAHGGAASANSGSGGGGSSNFANSSDGGAGGSGIVIIRYKFQ